MRLAAVVCAGGLLALSAASAATAATVVVTARAGPVVATLSYVRTVGRPAVTDVRLRVAREGRAVHDERLRQVGCRGCSIWVAGLGAALGELRARDLDDDREPEVVVDLWTGGAHCCALAAVYRWQGGRYRRTVLDFGNAGYDLVDLDRDALPELRSSDDRFSYAFAPYAYSPRPVRIWHWQAGRLANVTRRFPNVVRADAQTLFKAYARARKPLDPVAVRGALAAWAADMHVLGRTGEAWRRLEAARRARELGGGSRDALGYPAGARFITELRGFLRRSGYAG